MPDSYVSTINSVLARVRDQSAAMHPRELCTDLLTRLQRLYNNTNRFVFSTTTLPTLPMLQLYSFSDALQDSGMTITRLTHLTIPVEPMTLTQLRVIDPRWPRATGQRFLGYVQLGYSLVLLWPALIDASSVEITSTKLTTDVSTLPADGLLDIPSEHTPKLAQWLELLLLLRQRDMMAFEALMQQIHPRRQHGDASGQAATVAQA